MKNNLTARDVPKILIVLGLFLALGGIGWVRMQQVTAQQEENRANLQLKREYGHVLTPEEEGLTPEAADEAKSRREDADPNFHS